MPEEPDYIGRSNPNDEQPEEHINCADCFNPIYSDESFVFDEDKLDVCGDCASSRFNDILCGYGVDYKGAGIFKVYRIK